MSRYKRFSIRFLLLLVLIVAVALSVLHIPDSQSARFVAHLQAGRSGEALTMIQIPLSDRTFMSNFEDFLQTKNVSVSTRPPDIAHYFRGVRIVYVSNGMTDYEFEVGLFSVSCKYISERLASRGDFDEKDSSRTDCFSSAS